MKAKLMLGALFASACVSEPAYIGEGPGSEGASGSGGATSSGGGSRADRPDPGNGGAASGTAGGGAGVGLPSESGRCIMTKWNHSQPPFAPTSILVTWNAETRTFKMDKMNIGFDERNLPVERWHDEGFHESIRYDSMGVAASLAYDYRGLFDPDEQFEQTNTYDDGGRLETSTLVYQSGRRITESFAYMDGLPTGRPTIIEIEHATAETVQYSHFVSYDNGLPVRNDTVHGGAVSSRYTAAWDDRGRLVQVEYDWGQIGGFEIDGIIEARDRWFFDDEGRIIRAESEFQSDGEYPTSIDGTPEEIWTFEPECAAIAVDTHLLYGIPSWTFPYTRSRWNF